MIRALALAMVAAVAVAAASVAGQRGAESGRGTGPAPSGIAGRVVDASGAPVKDAFVTALAPNPERRYGFQPVNVQLIAVSDERGEYVLDHLTPGEYYVIALPRNTALDPNGRPNRVGYANTFHPSAVAVADAARVRVTLGRATANITLAPAKLAAVSGVVIGEAGKPVAGGRLNLARGQGLFGVASAAIPILSDGRFGLAGLQPGTYHLRYSETAWPPPVDIIPKVSGATVTVTDGDLTNVQVVPIPMVRAAGRVVIEPGLRSMVPRDGVSVGAFPFDFDGNPGPQRPGRINDDLTFEFRTWPSTGTVRMLGLPPDWRVGAIRLNGVDVTTAGIDFVGGKDVTGIEVELLKR